MAVSAIPASQARTIAQTNPATTQTQSQRYATTQTQSQRYIEQLDLRKASALERKAILWKVATAAVLIFAAIMTAIASMGSAALLLAGMPFIATLILSGLLGGCIGGITGLALARFLSFAQKAKFEAKEIRSKERVYRSLPTDLNALQLLLLHKGINWITIPGLAQNPEGLRDLKPYIAVLMHHEQRMEKYHTKSQAKAEKARLVSPDTELTASNRAQIAHIYKDALKLEKKALVYKFAAAAVHSALQGRASQCDGSSTPISMHEQMLGHTFNDPRYTEFFRFTNGNSITWDQMRNQSVAELSQHFAQNA